VYERASSGNEGSIAKKQRMASEDKALRLWVEDQLYALLGESYTGERRCLYRWSCSAAGLAPAARRPAAAPPPPPPKQNDCRRAGFAERALVDYCISLSKKTPNAARLATTLEAQGLPPSPETRRFAADLLARLPRAGAAPSAYKQQERAAAEAARKNAAYGLLPDEEDEEPPAAAAPAAAPATAPAPPPGGKKSHRRGRRDADAGDSSGGEDGGGGVRRESRKRAWQEDEADAARRAEEAERERDAAERAEFEARLKERDDAKTRKLAERRVPRGELEELARRRAAEEADDRAGVVGDLRKVSRQEYLRKREEAKLEELKEALEDEKYLFAGQRMTAKEARELAYKEEVYRLAAERKAQLAELEADDSYRMPAAYDDAGAPSDKRYEVLTARYRDVEEEEAAAADTPWAQQEAFEAEQIKKAVRAERRGGKKGEGGAEYEYVFEDQIEFIVDAYLAGERPVSRAVLLRGCFALRWVAALLRCCVLCACRRRHGCWCLLVGGGARVWSFEAAARALFPCHEFLNRLRSPAPAAPRPQEAEESKEEAAERERGEREAERATEFERLQADRRKLPMFPYREPLLQAIAEHQVIIIVGETGSGEP
jgi:pre-mRNA-splicing factor ATP-dependent RNA helicase DHX16